MPSDIDLSELTAEERRVLLEQLLDKDDSIGKEFVTSFAQERLWLLDQLTPSNPIYNICTAIRLHGSVVVDAMQAALNQIIDRHESLRTVIVQRDGVPFQRIEEPWQIPIPIENVSTQSDIERSIETFVRSPFDIAKGPLLRVTLLRLSSIDHIALFSMHHAIGDGWSLSLLIREFALIYSASLSNRDAELEPLPIQYVDYAMWQKEATDEQSIQKQTEYWLKQLADAPTLELPRDFPIEHATEARGQTAIVQIDALKWDAIKRLCRSCSATPFMGLLAAFGIVLSRWSGQSDFVVGTPVAGRNQKELEPLIGCFLNTLALRTAIDESLTFQQYLASVRDTTISALSNQDVPFEKLLALLPLPQGTQRDSLLRVMLNMLSYETASLELPNLTIERYELPETLAKFDLNLYAEPKNDGLELRLVYNAGVFSSQRIRLLLDQLLFVLHQATDDSNQKVATISLCTPNTKHRLAQLSEPIHAPSLPSIADLIRASASSPADLFAVMHRDQSLCYDELIDRAEKLATKLSRCVSIDHPVVAIRLEKSIDFIIAMTAIQIAHRTMLCIDVDQPEDRQQQLIELSGAHWIIDSSGLMQVHEPKSLSMWSEFPLVPAYVFFTSGSTGIPKAVVGNAQGLSQFAIWQRDTFSITADDRFAQCTAVSFDVLLRDVFVPLISGATICIPDTNDAILQSDILEWMNASKITRLHSVPSLLRHWLASSKQSVDSLRTVFSAGEPLMGDLCRTMKSRFPNASVVNLYGPTETTLAKLYKVIDEPRDGIQSIGQPIPNTNALIARGLEQCGIGEIGEIVIRTPYRSYGYLDRSLNAAAFIQNPNRNDMDDLLYRTGDQGRIGLDGDIEILGRIDDQLKIRGVRIEPAEVNAVLQQQELVKRSVVMPYAAANGEKQLVAYVELNHGNEVADSADSIKLLSAYCIAKLPAAMVPTDFMLLDHMPLLPNGKINRKALPAPTTQRADRVVELPLTQTEKTIASIWCEVLNVDAISRDDHFFVCGGHSLLAAQVMARLEQQLNVVVPLRKLFDHPRLDAFAKHVDLLLHSKSQNDSLPVIRKRSIDDGSPLSLAQEALWFLDRLAPNSGAYTTYPYLKVHGPLDINVLSQALAAVVARHDVLRTTFPEIDAQPKQLVASHLDCNVSVTELSESDLDVWIDSQARGGIDLQHGPIIRLSCARLNSHTHVLVVAWHHIIHDGWSLGVLAREILSAYQAIVQRQTWKPAELTIQYADWAVWQRKLLSGESYDRLASYWKQQLDGLPSLDIVTDYPRPKNRTTRGAFITFDLGDMLSKQIDRFANQHSLTPFIAMLTAFHLTLARFSSQSDFAIGSPVANRRKRELEDLIGYFVNMLVLRSNVAESKSFLDAAKAVRDTVLDAFEHQDMTLDQVVNVVNPIRDSSRHQLFQAMFVLHNNAPLPTQGSDLTFELPDAQRSQSAYFELNLVVNQTPEGYSGRLIYNSDLYAAPTADRIVKAWKLLLAEALNNVGQDWRSLAIIDAEQQQRLTLFSKPDLKPTSIDECSLTLHEAFTLQAARSPSSIAIVDGQKEFTYTEINNQSNAFANRLSSLGVQPNDFVALLLPRSVDAIVALMGILKVGAAYVPLDEKSPVSRNQAVLDDCKAAFFVCNEATANIADEAATKILIESDQSYNSTQPIRNAEPHDPAYVIYTSGSTGQPKGVVVSHQAVIAYVAAARQAYDVRSTDRVLQFSSLSFDAHVEEVFVTLLTGATLVLRSDEMLSSVQQFVRSCDDLQLSVLSMSTGFWHEIALETSETNQSMPHSLRTIIIGGEAAQPVRVAAWYKTHGDRIRLINSYGPTETTVVATTCDLSTSIDPDLRLPIGRPLANTRAYVLDSLGQTVPIGVCGELVLGGLSVADGYLDRETLNVEKFVADRDDDGCFGQRSSAKMYRTGDVVRWNDEGQLEFFGRGDHQLKVRGFRVELGEIENAIREHPLIKEAMVLADCMDQSPRLVAYVVTSSPNVINLQTLREFLAKRLPEYAMPVACMELDSFPTTVSGKTDRKAFPKIDWSERPKNQCIEPRTEVEKTLHAIVCDVLQRTDVSTDDDFFALGGNSLLVLRLVAKVRKQFNVELPLVDMFQSPTIAAIATWLEKETQAKSETDSTSLIVLKPSDVGHPIFCVHGLGGHVVNFIPLARELRTTRPIVAIQGRGIDGRNAPHDSIHEMAAHYVDQIVAIQPQGPYQFIGWSMGGLITLEVCRLLIGRGMCIQRSCLIRICR
jgi:amino acid adenylation domain-containing protein